MNRLLSALKSGVSRAWGLFCHLLSASCSMPLRGVRVGLRVPALSQGSLPIGATAFWHRELPLTVSPSWGEQAVRWRWEPVLGVVLGGWS